MLSCKPCRGICIYNLSKSQASNTSASGVFSAKKAFHASIKGIMPVVFFNTQDFAAHGEEVPIDDPQSANKASTSGSNCLRNLFSHTDTVFMLLVQTVELGQGCRLCTISSVQLSSAARLCEHSVLLVIVEGSIQRP